MTEESPEEAPKPTRFAKLDVGGIYVGMEELPEEELTEFHIRDITQCDLPPNKYKWNPEKKTFEPLKKTFSKSEIDEPNALTAIVLGLLAVEEQGIKLPDETRKWIAWYKTTVDFW